MAASLNGALSGAVTGASLGKMVPGIGTTLGAIGGGIMGLFGREKDRSRELAAQQQEYNKELMGLQFDYNEKAAQANQERNKEMWEFTSYPNQLKKMVEAGLSPGLMYGQAGAGGSTAGAQAAGTGIASGNQVAAAYQASIQGQMMNEQLNNMAADTALKLAEAENKRTDSENKRTIERSVANSLVKLQNASAENLEAVTKKVNEEAKILALDKEIKEETKESMIGDIIQSYWNKVYEGINLIKDVDVKDETIKKIKEETQYIAYNALTGRISANAQKRQAEIAEAYNEIIKDLGEKGIEQQELNRVKEYVGMAVNGLVNLVDILTDLVPTKAITSSIKAMGGRVISTQMETTTKRGK